MLREFKGLCHRCDHWARFLEGKGRPRFECGDVVHSCHECNGTGEYKDKKCTNCNGSGYILNTKHSCYMYKPVQPIVIAKDKDDNRPQFAGSIISARSHGVELADMNITLQEYSNGNAIYWTPKKKDN